MSLDIEDQDIKELNENISLRRCLIRQRTRYSLGFRHKDRVEHPRLSGQYKTVLSLNKPLRLVIQKPLK